MTGPATVTLPVDTAQTQFSLQRLQAGQAVTAPVTVVDRCGPWQTFVGQGTAS